MCPDCTKREGTFKCIDCSSAILKCAECTKASHAYLVLHRIQVRTIYLTLGASTNKTVAQQWNGLYFCNKTLQGIGLEVQAGHDHGEECPAPVSRSIDFEVLDVSGQHTVSIAFCGCPGARHIRVQLLRMRWFPASTERPNSAFTFNLLNTFQLLNLQGKISAYDFYSSMTHKTDNLGIREGPYKPKLQPLAHK